MLVAPVSHADSIPPFNKLSMPNLARAWMVVGCLQPDSTFQNVRAAKFASHMLKPLLHNFNELQSVLRSARLRTQLLDLPLPAMQLLLMDLQYPELPNEDAVLYTVHRYVQHQSTPELQELARQRLALLIRVPHLSNRWLLELLTARAPQHLVLHSLWEPIRMLVNLRELQRGKRWHIAGAPPSWQLGPRAATDQVLAVECIGRFSVSVIKQASCRAFEQQDVFDALPITDMQCAAGRCSLPRISGVCCGAGRDDAGLLCPTAPVKP